MQVRWGRGGFFGFSPAFCIHRSPTLSSPTLLADIGTTGTALFTSLGKQRAALRVSVCYLLQKIVGVVVVLPFLDVLLHIVDLTPSASPARRLANAHSLFNCVVAAVRALHLLVAAKLMTKML